MHASVMAASGGAWCATRAHFCALYANEQLIFKWSIDADVYLFVRHALQLHGRIDIVVNILVDVGAELLPPSSSRSMDRKATDPI
jgi:hypothetical protein